MQNFESNFTHKLGTLHGRNRQESGVSGMGTARENRVENRCVDKRGNSRVCVSTRNKWCILERLSKQKHANVARHQGTEGADHAGCTAKRGRQHVCQREDKKRKSSRMYKQIRSPSGEAAKGMASEYPAKIGTRQVNTAGIASARICKLGRLYGQNRQPSFGSAMGRGNSVTAECGAKARSAHVSQHRGWRGRITFGL